MNHLHVIPWYNEAQAYGIKHIYTWGVYNVLCSQPNIPMDRLCLVAGEFFTMALEELETCGLVELTRNGIDITHVKKINRGQQADG